MTAEQLTGEQRQLALEMIRKRLGEERYRDFAFGLDDKEVIDRFFAEMVSTAKAKDDAQRRRRIVGRIVLGVLVALVVAAIVLGIMYDAVGKVVWSVIAIAMLLSYAIPFFSAMLKSVAASLPPAEKPNYFVCPECGECKAYRTEWVEKPHLYFTSTFRCEACRHSWTHAGWSTNVRQR